MEAQECQLPDINAVIAMASAPEEVKKAFLVLCEKILFPPQALREQRGQKEAQAEPAAQQAPLQPWRERISSAVGALPVRDRRWAIMSFLRESVGGGHTIWPLDRSVAAEEIAGRLVAYYGRGNKEWQPSEAQMDEIIAKINSFNSDAV